MNDINEIAITKIEEVKNLETENLIEWVTFYRRNLHRFIEDYLGIKLYPHQRLEFYMMGVCSQYAEVCSRGSAKSWKAGVLAVAIAILYPNSEVVIVSETKVQAGIVIDKKIRPLRDNYENIFNEISSLTTGANKMEVEFFNGSTIFVVPLRDSARGNRSTFIIYEEFRLLDMIKLDKIISPFKHPRQTEYLKNPKYSHLAEESREVYITSSGHQKEEWYRRIEGVQKQSFKGRKSMCVFSDYVLCVKYNMKTAQEIRDERTKMDDETFQIEYENMCIKDNNDGYFPRSLIESCRTLKTAYYPQDANSYDSKKNPLAIPIKINEKICMYVDIAIKEGNGNDNTIIHIDRLVPTKKGYKHNIVYTEAMNGKNSLYQALRIKQLWYDFSANYIVLDVNGNGAPIYDILTEKTIDNSRGLEYPAMTTISHPSISKLDDYKQRTRALDAISIIYPMWATESINSEMAVILRDLMRIDMINLMCLPNDGEEFLIDNAKYFDAKKDMSKLAWFMRPYYQASELQGELLALTPLYNGNTVKLVESRKGRKDRYSALAYGCWFTKIVLDPQIIKETKTYNVEDMVITSSATRQPTNNKYFQGTNSNRTNNGRKLFGR